MQKTLGDQFGFDKVEVTPPELSRKRSKKEDAWIHKTVWAISGPIIVWPGYEDMKPPENIRSSISVERLLAVAANEDLASEAETMWYISTATLAHPPSHDWTEIYMYLCRKFMLKTTKKEEDLPDFLRKPIELAEYTQKPDLKRLREWLFERSMKALKCKLNENI